MCNISERLNTVVIKELQEESKQLDGWLLCDDGFYLVRYNDIKEIAIRYANSDNVEVSLAISGEMGRLRHYKKVIQIDKEV